MRHLNPVDIIDAAEGTPTAEDLAHLSACERCRGEVARASAVLREVRNVDAPEPSPLFWEHFSERIRRRLVSEPAPAAGAWPRWYWVPAGALVAILAASIGLWTGGARNVPPATRVTAPAAVASDLTSDEEGWSVVADVAESVEWSDAEELEFGLGPGTVERAALQLPQEQREELARLLRDEIGRFKS